MLRLPGSPIWHYDWTAERASGWWEIHHLVHESCGWRSWRAFDFIHDGDLQQVRIIITNHTCEKERGAPASL